MKEIFEKRNKREQKKKTGKQPADYAVDYTEDEDNLYEDKYPYQEDTGFLMGIAKKLKNLEAYGSKFDEDDFFEDGDDSYLQDEEYDADEEESYYENEAYENDEDVEYADSYEDHQDGDYEEDIEYADDVEDEEAYEDQLGVEDEYENYDLEEFVEENQYASEKTTNDEDEYETEEYVDDDEEYESEEYIEDADEEYESEEYIEDADAEYESEEYLEDADAEYESEEYLEDADAGYVSEEYAEDDGQNYQADEYVDDDAYESEEYADEYEAEEYADDEETTYIDDSSYTESEEYYHDDMSEEDEFYDEDSGYVDSDDIYETEEDGLTYVSFDEDDGIEDYEPDYEEDAFREHQSVPIIIFQKIAHFFKHLKPIDAILAGTGIIIFSIAIITIGSVVISKNVNKQIEALAPVGEELSSMGIVGESNLLALADNRKAAASIIDEGEEITSEESEVEENNVSVNFTSIEKDLKIKFTYASSGDLVTGTTFEVELTNSKGKAITLTDDDQDGVIYADNMTAGSYDAVVKSVGDFVFPDTAQKVTVKDKIEYVVINVQDEIKKESEINVAAEDTAQVNAAAEAEVTEATPTVTDTVEWVESTKTPVDGSSEYSKISKDTITDPSTVSKLANTKKLAGLDVTLNKSNETLETGATLSLEGSKFSDSSSDTEKVTYSYSWSSSDDSVASVSNGTVTAKKAGTATITYTVIKKISKTETSTTEKSKTISIDEYNALSSDEQKKCTEIKEKTTETTTEKVTNEDGEEVETEVEKEVEKVTGYTYNYSESSSNTTDSEEKGTATCSVTVKDVSVSSATLTLNQTTASVNVGATVTVAPSKVSYKYSNGKTEDKTSDFPTISWSSSDKAIATVSDAGVVTGVKAGTATITASMTINNTAVTATCKVTVNAVASLSLTLDQSKASVAIGKTVTIKPTVQNASKDSGVTWSTSDKSIATVDSKGVVTGIKLGTVTITATTNENSAATNAKVTATCAITVTSSATTDKTTLLKDNSGNQVYIKDGDGNYVKATYADYYTASKFYIQNTVQYTYTGWQTIDNNTYYYDKNGKYVTGTQVIQGVEYTFTSEGILKMNNGNGTLGIDVSKWNGNINWTAVKNAGVDFAIIRCGYRGSSSGALIEDSYFKTNIKNAKAAGIKVGIYFFTQAVNEKEAVEEASMAISLAKSYSLTYPIFIDTEGSGGRADGLDKGTRTAVVNAFCKTIANGGYRSGIYASKSWYENKLSTGSLSSYKIWLAQYASKPTYGGRYDMWQYSSKGSVGGISGRVDMNWSYLGY